MRQRDFQRMTLRTQLPCVLTDTFQMASRQLTDTCYSGLRNNIQFDQLLVINHNDDLKNIVQNINLSKL